MSNVRFTYDWYREFLERLRARGYQSRPYTATPGAGDLFLRHDVDFSPRKALRIARLEAELGVRSTFLFLVTSPAYNLWFKPMREVLGAIRTLGHEVGLHFSTHQYWSAEPDDAALRERVDAEFDVLSGLVDSPERVLSFHRPPEWVFGRSYDGFISTYEPRFFSEVSYLSDSNMRWRDEPPLPGAADTAAEGAEALQVLTHPGLWGRTDASFEARLRSEIDRELGRVRRFMIDQFVHKEYNVDDYRYPRAASRSPPGTADGD